MSSLVFLLNKHIIRAPVAITSVDITNWGTVQFCKRIMVRVAWVVDDEILVHVQLRTCQTRIENSIGAK